MTYRFKVSLPGIKGFARVYEVNGRNTLYQFHKQMVSDMEFPADQVVLFKAFDDKGNLKGRYATFDVGDGSIDNISINAIVGNGISRFTYFYDTIYKKSVEIIFEGEGNIGFALPTLVDSKGPNPEAFLNGYVAFEDLPAEQRKRLEDPENEDEDFDDEDDMEEDDGDEDGMEIYSEDEE